MAQTPATKPETTATWTHAFAAPTQRKPDTDHVSPPDHGIVASPAWVRAREAPLVSTATTPSRTPNVPMPRRASAAW